MKYDIDIDSFIGYPISKGYIKNKLIPFKGKPVTIRINSYGGDVQTALDIRQQFIDHGQVSAYIFGMTASAATMLAMGAKKIYMSRYALMLIHNASTLVGEWKQMNAEELKKHVGEHDKTIEDLKTIDDVIASLYCSRNGRTLDEMKELMKEEKWLSAERCKELGLIDEIIEEGEQLPAPTAAVRERFAACGLPVPQQLTPTASEMTILDRIRKLVGIQAVAEYQEESPEEEKQEETPQDTEEQTPVNQEEPKQEPKPKTHMNKDYPSLLEAIGAESLNATDDGSIALTAAQLQQIENRLQELENEDGDTTDRIEEKTEPGTEDAMTDALKTYNLIHSLI